MRCTILALASLTVFAVSGISQTPPPDSDPVLQGKFIYTMPQSAIEAEIDGKVVMAIHLEKTGKPTRANLVAGPMWPCGKTPTSALEDLSSTLSETVLKLQFTPAIKDSKPTSSDIYFSLTLKNSKVGPEQLELDPDLAKSKGKIINGGVLNGKALALPKPFYPAAARANRYSGAVSIQVFIDEKGKVTRAGAVNGLPILQIVSREAACEAKFSPTTLSGQPVKVTGVITYNFIP